MKWDGSILEPLEESDFDTIIQKIEAENIKAVAVCLIHSYINPEHELQARAIINKTLPEVSVTLSHEIAREWREYERASSAVANAYIAPIVEHYLISLETQVREMGVRSPLHVMQSSGGVMTLSAGRKQPVYTLLSGPVGGTIGGVALSSTLERPNLLCVDMGGTSFDLSLVVNGQPEIASETELEGLPLLMPMVNIHTIGAGGGSVAWLETGAVRVGPQSAGAVPGPVCYGNGGTQPTVTDANLFLKRLGSESLLSGRMTLSERAAADAIHNMAEEVGLGDLAFAEGMLSITNAKMADAMRTITVEQGIDPRQFSLVAFGGAGPMHAVWLARELDIKEVIIPRFPGTFSAWGMLQTDVRQDITKNFYFPMSDVQDAVLTKTFSELEAEGLSGLRNEGVRVENIYFVRTADMRYIGQEYAVNVEIVSGVQLADIETNFHRAHHTRYGHSTPNAPVEFVNLRLAALGRLERRPNEELVEDDKSGNPVIGTRETIFDGEPHQTNIYIRDRLTTGTNLAGPAVIEEDSATTVVPPGYQIQIDNRRNIVVTSGD
jgi:N-methylhydantoinase A